jgi:LEA14-like dessication related protein
MHKKSIIFMVLSSAAIIVLVASCAGVPRPDEGNFKDPLIGLDHVEISYYTGFYYYSKAVTPTRGKADDYGAPLLMSFVYKLYNPNPYPVMLDGFAFSILFEGFKINHVISRDAMWIPAGRTNLLRMPAMFDTRQTLLALILPEAMKLREKNISPWDLLERWWIGAPDFSYPIRVTEGAAVFRADGVIRTIPFAAHYPY